MNTKKKGPYILLAILIIVLFFILGMQYGKQVERADKMIRYVLSITPSQAPSPTPAPAVAYNQFSNSGCGVAFLYPDNLTIANESSSSAKLSRDNPIQTITLSCSDEAEIATDSAAITPMTIGNQRIYKRLESADEEELQGQIVFEFQHPQTAQVVTIMTEHELAPLIESSLQFLP